MDFSRSRPALLPALSLSAFLRLSPTSRWLLYPETRAHTSVLSPFKPEDCGQTKMLVVILRILACLYEHTQGRQVIPECVACFQ